MKGICWGEGEAVKVEQRAFMIAVEIRSFSSKLEDIY